MFSEFLIFFLAKYSLANTCCMPRQWSATERFIMFSTLNGQNVSSITQASYNISVDNGRKMMYAVGNTTTDGTESYVERLFDYNHMKQYSVVDGICYVSSPDPFPGPCIPANATVIGSGILGTGSDSTHVTQYQFSLNNLTMQLTVTDGCVPVTNAYHGHTPDSSIKSNVSYTNVHDYIRHEEFMKVPRECSRKGPTPIKNIGSILLGKRGLF